MIQPNPQSFSRPKYRPDVDGMRALAILSVLIFHAYPSSLPGGFVGVDIFFVISGYLISSIIFRGLTLGTFSFFDFYARRVRRIFPAVTVVILGSFLLGFFFLTPYELEDLIRESPYAAFFLENWRLYVTTGGYWETATELKPFMHFWSLGVEEQYYIFYPLICFLLWKASAKRFLASLVLMLLVSLGLCLYDTANEPVRAFYSLHTRFWELLIGGVLAYVELKWPDYKGKIKYLCGSIDNVFSVAGLLLILFAIAFFEEGKDFPGWRALFPTVGSVLIIAAGTNAYLNKYVFSNKVAVFIGLISYPLYLWHWPFICIFRNNLAGELPSGWLMVTLIGLSFLMAYLTYTVIERPMRSRKASWKLVLALTALLAVVTVGSKEFLRKADILDTFINNGAPSYVVEEEKQLPHNLRTDKVCENKFGKGFAYCRAFGTDPNVVIIGDSHAHVLLKYFRVQQPRSSFYLVANDGLIILDDVYESERKRGLSSMHTMNLFWEEIEKDPKISTVVFRGFWGRYLQERLVSEINPDWSNEELFAHHFSLLIQKLLDKNKEVVVVLDNPELSPETVKKCQPTQRVSLLPPNACQEEVPLTQIHPTYFQANEILLKVLDGFGDQVEVVDISKSICKANECYVKVKNNMLYQDEDHLSVTGSRITWPLIENAFDE